MFARDGYIPLSRLWRDFEGKYLTLCKERALACMEADPHSPDFVFGTALDLCEDVFLMSFDRFELELVPPVGEVVQVEPVVMRSGARLLLKTTAIKSALISMFPDEAGPDGKWLKQMGSSNFCAADDGFLWPDKMGRDTGVALEKVLFANLFHTLPVLFERQTFVIAKELPPWSKDLLEDSYIRNVWQGTRGFSICFSEASAQLWKRSLTSQSLEMIFKVLVPFASADVDAKDQSAGGRPQKVNDVMRAYEQLGLVDAGLTRKEELRRVEAHLGEKVSPSTLDRVRRILRTEEIGKDIEQP